MKRERYTHVYRGTYQRIAKRLGYSKGYVAMVARGERSNVIIERELAREVLNRKNHEAALARLKKRLKDEN